MNVSIENHSLASGGSSVWWCSVYCSHCSSGSVCGGGLEAAAPAIHYHHTAVRKDV